jgi:hypothetical protein
MKRLLTWIPLCALLLAPLAAFAEGAAKDSPTADLGQPIPMPQIGPPQQEDGAFRCQFFFIHKQSVLAKTMVGKPSFSGQGEAIKHDLITGARRDECPIAFAYSLSLKENKSAFGLEREKPLESACAVENQTTLFQLEDMNKKDDAKYPCEYRAWEICNMALFAFCTRPPALPTWKQIGEELNKNLDEKMKQWMLGPTDKTKKSY